MIHHRAIGATLFGAVLMSLSSVSATAQDGASGVLVGTVSDEASGLPLAGVTIEIRDHGKRATTDSDGLFEMADLPSGNLAVRVELSGYATVTEQIEVLPDEIGILQLQLSPLAYALQGIVVRAWRGDPGAASVERDAEPAGSALDLIRQQVPGVLVRSRPGARSGVRVRAANSLSASPPVVYLDGVRLGEGGSNVTISALEQIPAERVLRIRVLRGPSAEAAYADAASGVILVETR
jgi:iron complex outermembrane receptor protein